MSETIQISAYISAATKARLESLVKDQGLKKARIVEDALLHHLQALSELPNNVIISPRLVLSESSMQAVAKALESPPLPTEALQDLWREQR
jgi:hypothetical protein